MKLAIIALAIAVILGLGMGARSLLGYDESGIGALLGVFSTVFGPPQPEAVQLPTNTRVPQEIAVPNGTFKGPTANPTIKGPSANPPQE
jgi:hypothetical protein